MNQINGFSQIVDTFGVYYLHYFSVGQITLTALIFNGYKLKTILEFISLSCRIVSFISQTEVRTNSMLNLFVFASYVVSFILPLYILVNSMTNAYEAVKNIGNRLQEQLRTTVDDQSRQDLSYLIGKVDRIDPPTAAGFFTIDRSCLTSMVSVR